jgi:apolipoprotein D and lipocalin family protein
MEKNKIDPVQNFDLTSYLGLWYEIARLPNSFEKGLEEITAEYLLNPDGTVKVVNSGLRALKNERDYSFGKAWLAGSPSTGLLKVRFLWPFTAQYKIILLDTEYQYSVVVSSGFRYLWILSRHPHMDDDLLSELIDTCASMKFNVSRLIYPSHTFYL